MQAADVVWLTALAGLGAADIALLKTGRSLLTDSARAHKWVTAAVLTTFLLHVFDWLGPADPFRAIARTAHRREGTCL